MAKRDLYKIVENHCRMYSPTLVELQEVYGISLRIIDKDGKRITVDYGSLYICPLCCRNIIAADNGELSFSAVFDLDHYPPKSVGGKKKILTCKDCNGGYGSDIDYTLKEYLLYRLFETRQGSTSMKMKVEGIAGKYNLEVTWDTKKEQLVFVDKKKPSHFHKEFGRFLINGPGLPFNLTLKRSLPPANAVRKAILKAAYLEAFSTFGYEFVYSSSGEYLRSLFAGNTADTLLEQIVWFDVTEPLAREGIYMLCRPIRAFMIPVTIILGPQIITSYVIIAHMHEGVKELANLEEVTKGMAADIEVRKMLPILLNVYEHLPFSTLSKSLLTQ